MKTKQFLSMLLVMLMSVTGAWPQMTFIKEVKVSGQSTDGNYEDLEREGYTVAKASDGTYFDFNGGGTGGDYVYIGYKTTTDPREAISNLAILYHEYQIYPDFGSDDFLYGGSETMMIEGRRYYLAPYSNSPDMNNGNKKHVLSVYLYYTRDINVTDGTHLLTEIGGLSLRSVEPTVPEGWDSMIQGHRGYIRPTADDGSQYYEFWPQKESEFGDTNLGGGGYDSYITTKYSDVHYVDVDGQIKLPEPFTVITNETKTLNDGWYLVSGEDVKTGSLTCEGKVNLILMDYTKLTANGLDKEAGIKVSAENASLTIYGQKYQTGRLIANGGYYGAGIGGAEKGEGHDITINGGVIIATGGMEGAGIGGGDVGSGHDITINNGVVTATGGRFASGIGGGYFRKGYNIRINGGVVTANGGELASAIGGGDSEDGHDIYVNSALSLFADNNNPPATLISHDINTDMAGELHHKLYAVARIPAQYITVTLDKQGGTGGSERVTVNQSEEMPTITVPTREGYYFHGYYSGQNGTGIKYYNLDGTSAHVWNLAENTRIYAYWKQAIPYIDADGTEKYVGIYDDITNSTTTMTAGWYAVSGTDVQTGSLVCEGEVHLILMDGAKLTANGNTYDAGIRVSAEGASLTIYGQKNQTGQLIANGGDRSAGIGGEYVDREYSITGHDITINGGVISATGGGENTAAIGGGLFRDAKNIFVNSAMTLFADDNNPPTTFISHATGVDVSGELEGKQYAIVRRAIRGITVTLDKQGGTEGSDQVTVNENEEMPKIDIPTYEGSVFFGYFADKNGLGTKYYNADGTSAHVWDLAENTTLYAYWKHAVPYIDADGTEQYVSEYDEITSSTTTLTAGWYVVNRADMQTGQLVCEGEVHLILMDGAMLTANGNSYEAGIRVSAEGASLTIYGQSEQTGQLIANGGQWGAGIGGQYGGVGRDITINGGKITATGGQYSAGIGGGYDNGYNITINGGEITATGGQYGAGIGGGYDGEGYNITINGGVITANGGDDASAIGGGYSSGASNIFINYSVVLIADGDNPPSTFIHHRTDVDVSDLLSGKQYAIVRMPKFSNTITFDKQEGEGGDNQVIVEEGLAMPSITVPTRNGFAFQGYYTEENGTGTKYYNSDGTSAHHWDISEDITLYANWKKPFTYVNADGAIQSIDVYDDITSTDAVKTLSAGWYVVKEADVQTKTLVCEGAVHLILADGAKLTVTGNDWDAGIRVSANRASLTIYGQEHQTGQLIANGGLYGAGIGGEFWGNGHDITINGGVITATGGENAPAIGGGANGDTYNIFVNSSLALWADENNPPAATVLHTTGEDVSEKLAGKQYVKVNIPIRGIIVTLDKQDGEGGDSEVTVDEGSAMPSINVPHRDGYIFHGYYSGIDGTGIKYYNADGSSVIPCNLTQNTTLYACWRTPVSYVDEDGTIKYTELYDVITNSTKTLAAGWYVVRDADVQTSTLVCEGAVNLILADGAKLTATGNDEDAGIRVSAEDASLTIFGQQDQTGQLFTYGGFCGAGIGGGINGDGSNITINGGTITAEGGNYATAIGGGDEGSSSNIKINAALILMAHGDEEPDTEIEHTSSEDLASALSGKRYATIALPSVTLNRAPEFNAHFSTFYHEYAAYTVPNEDATIYTASVEDYQGETCLVLHKIEGSVIPADTPVILSTEGTTTINLKPCEDASGITVPENSLSGASLPMEAPANCHILSYGQCGLGFYQYAVGKPLAAHKAYLIYAKPTGTNALSMVFEEDEETGVSNIFNNDTLGDDKIYSISGARMSKLQRGVNIVNGKKVMVK